MCKKTFISSSALNTKIRGVFAEPKKQDSALRY